MAATKEDTIELMEVDSEKSTGEKETVEKAPGAVPRSARELPW